MISPPCLGGSCSQQAFGLVSTTFFVFFSLSSLSFTLDFQIFKADFQFIFPLDLVHVIFIIICLI